MTDAIGALSAWLATLPPAAQAGALFLTTFVLEDVATLGAGVLLAAGTLSWPAAFWPCFVGVWLGDAGLYAVARFGGRRWLERTRWYGRVRDRVARSERWFAERGSSALWLSRLVPGARLPTYLASGFLRMPAGRFLAITGAASLLWTVAVLRLTEVLGGETLAWLGTARSAAALVVTVALALVLGARGGAWLAGTPLARRAAAWLARWRHWEFWPGWAFYPPVVLYCLWLAIRHRGLGLPTAANPGMVTGGVVGESKIATLRDLARTSPDLTAPAELLPAGGFAERWRALEGLLRRGFVGYPFVLKPDVGQRGAGVKVIRREADARAYLRRTAAPLVVQRYAPGPVEVGVFYYRFPDEAHGRVLAVTEKVFPAVTGDGTASVEELVRRDPRARYLAETYLGRLGARRAEVLPAGRSLTLVEAGNHAQGCIFRDGMHLLTPQLERRIDEMSRKLAGFFIGRYDLRCPSLDDLRAGRGLQVVELNGAASEATSVYDARNSLWTAYRTLCRQWGLVFAVGAANRARGVAPTPLAEVWRAWRDYRRLAATYPAAD